MLKSRGLLAVAKPKPAPAAAPAVAAAGREQAKAQAKKIFQAYHTQLTTGCGDSACNSRYCHSNPAFEVCAAAAAEASGGGGDDDTSVRVSADAKGALALLKKFQGLHICPRLPGGVNNSTRASK